MNTTQEKQIQTLLAWIHAFALTLVFVSSVLLFGFHEAVLSHRLLHGVQLGLLIYLVLANRLGGLLGRPGKDRRDVLPGAAKRWSLEAKIVLSASLCLTLLGTVLLLIFQQEGLARAGVYQTTVLDAFFQSVTARTAGFNTVDIDALTPPVDSSSSC